MHRAIFATEGTGIAAQAGFERGDSPLTPKVRGI